MNKTLYIHIGHYKTGTTALQVFFDQSERFLKQNGFQYPRTWYHNSKHSAFAFSILRAAGVQKLMYNYDDPITPQDMWGELFDTIMRSKVPNTLISSEEFMRIGQFPDATSILQDIFEHRPDDLTIKAIAYLRDPASHLNSWYNQLIKMNFPVADLNAAVDGDIERIHYDYRQALSPWIDTLGQENVIIRPYIHDKEAPDALHMDFFKALGIILPEGSVQVERDPNPRMDDRVLELVRVMQNMGLPRPTITAIRNNSRQFLEHQDTLRYGGDNGIDAVRERARAGLEWLEQLDDCSVPTQDYVKRLPAPIPQQTVDFTLLLGFVFSEFIQLRQRVNNAGLMDLNARITALEERLNSREATK